MLLPLPITTTIITTVTVVIINTIVQYNTIVVIIIRCDADDVGSNKSARERISDMFVSNRD